MLAAYIFCLVVGGGFLLLSLFGDFLEADADIDADADLGIGDVGDVAKLFSLRAIIYALFGFGAAGTLLHLVWGGGRPGLTAIVAGVTGLATGALIGAAFGFLKRGNTGTMLGEQSFVGLTAEVSLEITAASPGSIRVLRGDRRHGIRARLDASCPPDSTLRPGQSVVVVSMASGIAAVVPVEMKLIDD
ncbi:MAG: hypothetical protein OXE73_08945 [Gammaproteobacteria bacterium]|nr:hypothetical protein [Gammaproteobacteria bacterium]